MSDKKGSAGAGTARRGDTGEDRTARDWAGSEEPQPPDAESTAAAADPATAEAAMTGDATTDDARAAGAVAGKKAVPEGSVDADAGPDGPTVTAGAAAADEVASTDVRPPAGAGAGPGTGADRAGPVRQDTAAPDAGADSADATAVADSAASADSSADDSTAQPPAESTTEPPAEEPPRQIVRATGPPRRPPMLVQGLWPALLAGGLVAATLFGLLPLTVAVLGIQLFLVLGALALLDAPASGGAFVLATGAILAADAVVLTDDGRIGGLAGVVGLGLVGSLLHQLIRKGRSRVTESLADTLVVIVIAVAAACLLALRQVDGGEQVLLISISATGAVLLAGRIGDRLAPRPMLAAGSTRGWPGLLLGLGTGVAVAVLVADADVGDGNLPLRSAALLGLVIASTVATADLAVDLGAAELRAGWRDARRVAALRPTALLLPFAVLGPVALLAGRLVLA